MMYFIATRCLKLATGLTIEKNDRVPESVPLYLCLRYEKLDFMKKVFDSEAEPDETKIIEPELLNETYILIVDDYKKGKEIGGKKGLGIKKLAEKYGLSQHAVTKIIKREGLL